MRRFTRLTGALLALLLVFSVLSGDRKSVV